VSVIVRQLEESLSWGLAHGDRVPSYPGSPSMPQWQCDDSERPSRAGAGIIGVSQVTSSVTQPKSRLSPAGP
jgi:hypothetical protein